MKQGQSQTRQKYAVYYGISCQYIYRLICSVPLSRDLFSARILWGGRTCYALWSNVGPGLLNCFCKCKTFLEEIDTAVFITVSFTVYESKVDTRLPWTSFVFGSQFFSAEVIHSSDKAFQLSEMQLMLPTLPFVFFPDSTTEPSGFLRFLPRVPSEIGDDRSSARHYVADAKDPTNFKQLNATWP